MSATASVKVTDAHNRELVARFVHLDDARTFAVASTSNEFDSRVLLVEDRAGRVAEYYASGRQAYRLPEQESRGRTS